MFRITRRKLNAAFWLAFILAGAFLISGLITGTFFADIILSLLVITAGLHGILEEVTAKENRGVIRKIDTSIQQLSEWFQKSHLFAKDTREKFDFRLHKLDTKRGQLDQKLEKRSRDLMTRMIYLENKYNSLQKSLAPEIKPLSTFERRVGRAILTLKKEGMITTAVYSSTIGVSRTVAGSDLKKMAGMNIVRKRGSGRNAYYILAV